MFCTLRGFTCRRGKPVGHNRSRAVAKSVDGSSLARWRGRSTGMSRLVRVSYTATRNLTRHRTMGRRVTRHTVVTRMDVRSAGLCNSSDNRSHDDAEKLHDATTYPGLRFLRFGVSKTYSSCSRVMRLARRAGCYLHRATSDGRSLADLQEHTSFQRAQGWTGSRTNEVPDPATKILLDDGLSHGHGTPPAQPAQSKTSGSPYPDYPGQSSFGPDCCNTWILMLRLRLISAGWAEDQRAVLGLDPDLRVFRAWDDELRAACERFQLAQGWCGTAAEGFPTEETWRRLWS